MKIITREQWGARYRAGFGYAPTATEVWLHHSAGLAPDEEFTDLNKDSLDDDEVAVMRRLDEIGQGRFNGGISYTFIVMPSGRIYEGTGAGRQGAHTGGRNTIARAICWPGNYEKRLPTAPQLIATAALLAYGEGRSGYWVKGRFNGGHQDAPGASTACPGKYAKRSIATINHYVKHPPGAPAPTPEGEVDVIFQHPRTKTQYLANGGFPLALSQEQYRTLVDGGAVAIGRVNEQQFAELNSGGLVLAQLTHIVGQGNTDARRTLALMAATEDVQAAKNEFVRRLSDRDNEKENPDA